MLARMPSRPSDTMLPPLRRARRRDWGRLVARVLCVLFAVLGLVPVGVGLLIRTSWARGIATRETQNIVRGLGIDARYDLELRLWPLSVTLRNVRVASSDRGAPLLESTRISARPKIFGLLAGKVVIDEIEVLRPKVRVVLRDGKLQNLALDLPASKDDGKPTKAPFSVVSASEGEVDVDVDGVHFHAREIDADVTTDDDGRGGTAFEVAVRVAEARSRMIRQLPAPTNKAEAERLRDFAVDEDTLCRIDGRARIEKARVLVRRLTAYGAADLDGADDTALGCDVSREDKRFVDVELGHLSVGLPKDGKSTPSLDGHVKVRAPLALAMRAPGAPLLDGWVQVDAEMRFDAQTVLPDVNGRIEGHDLRADKFSFARTLTSDVLVRRSVVTSPLTRVEIADGIAEIRDVEVRPLEKGIPAKAQFDAHGVDFNRMIRDFHVSAHPHVTWSLDEVHAHDIKGTLDPLFMDGDLRASTSNFAVFAGPADDKASTRATGVSQGNIAGKLAIRPWALEFHACTVTAPRSRVEGVFVSIGYTNILKVDIAGSRIDLADLTPLGSIPIRGNAEASVHVTGTLGDPHLVGEAKIDDFVLGDIPFGNVTQAHAALEGVVLTLTEVHGQKGKSTFEMPTARLDFGGAANMQLDAQVTSRSLDLRDFFAMFHLDEDPRFEQIGATLATSARVHLALGGPEDKCGGGFLDVHATTDARNVDLLGEKFEEGHADFDYRWADRNAGIEGAEVEVRSLSLTKVKKEGRAPLGAVLGSAVVHRGGELRGSLVLQSFPLGRADLLGKAASSLEGTVSGLARIGGTVSAFEIDADLGATPVRVQGVPFGASDLHVRMTQKPQPRKAVGKTGCGAPIGAPFDRDAYLADTSEQGAYEVDGALFGKQVRLDHVVVTRQKSPVVTGHIELAKLDVAPIGAIMALRDLAARPDEAEGQPGAALGGEISGELVMDRVATDDLARARARFTPKTVRFTRGAQKIEMRPTQEALTVGGDELRVPPVTFDLVAANSLKGVFQVKGAVTKLTRGGDLAIDAELSPIDLGILVGVVPRITRAVGTLGGAVRLKGKIAAPEFDGRMSVRGGELSFKGMPGSLTDVEIDAEADENEARITRGVGKFLGGDLTVTGHLPIKNGSLGIASATITGRQLSLEPASGVKTTVDTALEVTINPQATTPAGRLPFIGGSVDITAFEYSLPITLNLNGLKGGAQRTVVDAYDPSLDAVTLGIDVRSRAPLRIRNNLVEAQLQIDPRGLRVSGTNQRYGIRGEMVTLPGGRFRVFANDFELQKGTIRFDDPTRVAPHVDITATTEYRRYASSFAQGAGGAGAAGGAAGGGGGTISSGGSGGNLWRIAMHAYGDTDDLRVDMTSDPALSREDIFFLLTIGLTRAEVDQVRAGSVYASAAFEAIGTVSGADRAVKTAIPVIDDFRFGSAYSARTGRTEPQVTLGRRLGDNLRANVSTGLTEDRQLRANVELRLSRPLSVQASYDNISVVSSGSIGNFGLDFRWRLEFN
jgi:translocation and assembly module TamB